MSLDPATARKKVAKIACKTESLIHRLWRLEAALTATAASGDPDAEELASDIACVCVDHLHSAVASMREAGKPRRRDQPALASQGGTDE